MDPTAPRRRSRPAGGASTAQRSAQRRHVSGPVATVAPAEPGIGDVLGGRYRIDSELGYGGMAHVYRARDELLQRDVAIKVFRSNVSEAVDPKRTTREMHILASLSHPAVVSVLDASDDAESGAYIVMELVDGDDLGTTLRAGPVPPEQARRIAGDVASALEALHARSIVHRDVKPANILVLSAAAAASGGIAAKLTDFGIAQLIDGTRITGPESILGTAAFLSPEQVRAERVGPASDVYSLGLVLLECLTGQRVFPGSGAETAVARLTRAPTIPPMASAGLAELLRGMTALDPGARPTAGEVAEQLREDLVGGMLAGEDASTAQTPAVPMSAIAAASMPLATGPVRATGSVPTGFGPMGSRSSGTAPTGRLRTGAGAAIPAGTGGIGTAFPDALPLVDEPEDPAHRRRRLGLLSALIGAFAALVAAAAVVFALLPGTTGTVAPAEGQIGSAPASTPAASHPAASHTAASSGAGASSGTAGSGSSRSSAGTASSGSASPSSSASSSSTASTSSSPSPSREPTGSTSSGTSSTPSSGSTDRSSSPATSSTPSDGSTSSAPTSSSPSTSSSSSSSSSTPPVSVGLSTGDGTAGTNG